MNLFKASGCTCFGFRGCLKSPGRSRLTVRGLGFPAVWKLEWGNTEVKGVSQQILEKSPGGQVKYLPPWGQVKDHPKSFSPWNIPRKTSSSSLHSHVSLALPLFLARQCLCSFQLLVPHSLRILPTVRVSDGIRPEPYSRGGKVELPTAGWKPVQIERVAPRQSSQYQTQSPRRYACVRAQNLGKEASQFNPSFDLNAPG